MKTKLLVSFVLILCCRSVFAQDRFPSIPATDRIRLAEAFRLADEIGNDVWPNWRRAPFAVLLVTPEYEFLIRHPKPSNDFAKLPYDPVLKSDVYYRKRKFPTSFLATFPAVRGSMISTIVVGEAENTWVKTSTPWVITLLHEHFHQLQDSHPNFYADVGALNPALGRGRQSICGIWLGDGTQRREVVRAQHLRNRSCRQGC